VRRSIAELASFPRASQARIAGRVLTRDDAGCVLSDASGSVRCLGAAMPEVMALCMVEGSFDGDSFVVSRVVHAQATRETPASASEFHALMSRGREKALRLRGRAKVLDEVRAYFRSEDFLEVDTPLAVPSPGLDLHLDAMRVEMRGRERYLITSPEYQMKRLLAGGLERIVQIGKCFRKDEIGERHQPEFTMVEWYRAWAGIDDVMRDTEQLVAHVARAVGGSNVLKTALGEVDVTPPWPRLSVREALAKFAGEHDMEALARDEEAFYRAMIERVEPALTELGAVMLCEYPASMASLARKKPGDERVAERFEAYVAGVELCNGFGELTDPVEQRARFEHDQRERERLGLPVYPIDERFVRALEEGIPPSGGNALGLDRLVMLALGAAHIEDVLAIPYSRL
jgi:lysyl-tRNA synthetase class 2